MDSATYWKKREEEALQRRIKDEAQYDKEIEKIYRNMLDQCQKEIESFYTRYAKRENISLAEAKKRVSKLDIERYERKAKKYVKEKDLSKEANEEMRLYNLTMKVNRLEMLKANIGLELISGADELEKFMAEILQERTEDELKRQAGILGKTIVNNAKKARSIVNASFHGATFSTRLWANSSAMNADLGKLIQSGMIAGKNPRAICKDLEKYFVGEPKLKNGRSGAQFSAERLMRTELARVQTEAQKMVYEEEDIEEYEFMPLHNCCDICREVAKKNKGIYKVKDMEVGANAPPCHPFCRCTTAPRVDRSKFDAWLDYVGNGGTDEYEAWLFKNANEHPDVLDYKRTRSELNNLTKELEQSEKETDELMDKLMDAVGTPEESRLNELFEKKYDETELLKAKVEELKKQLKEKEPKALKGFEEHTNTRFKFTTPARLDGMSFEVAEKVVATYEKVFNRYPELVGKLNGFALKKIDNYGQAVYSRGDELNGYIYLNKAYFGNATGLDALAYMVKDAVAGAEAYEYIIVHEIGHAIDAILDNEGLGIGNRVAQNKILRSLGIDTKDRRTISEMLSNYANTHPAEFMAEGFAESVTSPKPRTLARAIEKAYREYIKKKLQETN